VRVFEDRLLKKIFGLKKEEVTGDWGKLHKEELHDLIFLTKQRYGDQIEEVAECGMLEVWDRREMGSRYCWGNLKERDHLECLAVSGKVILNCTLNVWDRMAWT
jgi:hypothetical protein